MHPVPQSAETGGRKGQAADYSRRTPPAEAPCGMNSAVQLENVSNKVLRRPDEPLGRKKLPNR